MNPVIEYVLRDDKLINFLKFPCSLFLENKRGTTGLGGKLILSLYKFQTEVYVYQYSIWKTHKNDEFPPFREYIVPEKEIFKHPNVIIPGFKLLDFAEEPYVSPLKHVSELPDSIFQELGYKSCIEGFFNTNTLMSRKYNWLWRCFYSIYRQDDLRWKLWQARFIPPCTVAPELIFAKAYNSSFLQLST